MKGSDLLGGSDDALERKQALAHRVVEAILEMAVLPPLMPRLKTYFDKTSVEKDLAFVVGAALLVGQSQTEMRIEPQFQSATNFAQSVAQMQQLEARELPSEVLESLLDCVKLVYAEGRRVQEGDGPAKEHVIGADVFLDILVYVAVQARLKRPFRRLTMAWALCDPAQLQSEGGYYLTVLESAFTFIASTTATPK